MATPQYPLILVRQVVGLDRTLPNVDADIASKSQDAARIREQVEDYERMIDQVDTVLRRLSLSERVKEYLDRLEAACHELWLLMAALPTSEEHAVVDTNNDRLTIRELLDGGESIAKIKVDKITLKTYYRKLASKYHPDHGGGNAQIFARIKDAYKAGALEVLYLYWIEAGMEEDKNLGTQTYNIALRRAETLRSSPSYEVARTYMSGKPALAEFYLTDGLNNRTRLVNRAIARLMNPEPT